MYLYWRLLGYFQPFQFPLGLKENLLWLFDDGFRFVCPL